MYSKEFREFFWAAYEAQFNNILALYEEVKTIPPVFGRRTTFNDSIPLFSHAEDMLKELENIKKKMPYEKAIEAASGTYGRFDEAVKKIDPREE